MSERREFDVIGKRVGNYVVERGLAHGAMGTVFVARHPTLGRRVAVKFLGRDEELPADHSKRFLDEACITASLHHPNIVDIFDFGELDGRPYYIMELLEGQDLAAVIGRERRFSCEEVRTFVEQICSGLEAAHAVGVVHRDLKPSNIFVLTGKPTSIKLMDFGVAKVMTKGGDWTRQGQIIGTPRYMSPEQALGQIDQISPLSDVYSLGVIVYEMLTGGPLFEHDSPMMLLVMHIRDEIRPIRDRNPDIAPQVAQLIESCLCKRPDRRPGSAREVAERFGAAMQEGLHYEESAPSRPRGATPADSIGIALPATSSGDAGHGLPPTVSVVQQVAHPIESVPVDSLHEVSAVIESAHLTPPEAEAGGEPKEVVSPNTLRLSKTDRSTLNRLWLKMQRGGDLPAFMRNVGEVSKRADFEGTYSATQLGDSILKDYALTAKLLKVVNSAYANRFGGKVYSVQHAIVILGFDRVRSLALSISLFKNRGDDEYAQRVSESAINSLVSGELAQHLARYARVFDEEQAMMCGMFRNLGRHLAIVYLPELYEQMTDLVRAHGLTAHSAAERIFGLSLQKLGLGVAERWRLPKPILRTMSALPGFTGHFSREEDRLVELADFSNELCDIVVGTPPNQQPQVITNLLVRHKNLVSIDPEKLAELLQGVQQSFEQRYASLLGLDAKVSRFSRNLSTLVSQPENETNDKTGSRINAPQLNAMLEVEVASASRRASPVSVRLRAARPKPQAQRIQLAKINVTAEVDKSSADSSLAGKTERTRDTLDERINELSVALDRHGRSDKLFNRIVTLFAECLDLKGLLVLKVNSHKTEIVIAGGLRDDLDALTKEFRIPLLPPKASGDVFSRAYHQGKDIVINDSFGVRANAIVPLCYYETIGSPTFALYSCGCKGYPQALVLIDVESPLQIPPQQRLTTVAKLRPLLARSMA